LDYLEYLSGENIEADELKDLYKELKQEEEDDFNILNDLYDFKNNAKMVDNAEA